MIITFSGTDGAGKSTQIKLLEKQLKNNNKKYKTVWARGGYTPLFSYAKKLLRILLPKKIPKAGPNQSRSKILENSFISKFWLVIASLDLFLFYAVYVRTLSFINITVICDRYIEDTELDFTRNFSRHFDSNSFLWRILIYTIPKPDYSFLLYVPVNTSIKRSIEKNEPFPDSLETLNFRLNAYLGNNFASKSRHTKIDCERSIEEIQLEILSRLDKVL
jgi:dTMP kinase